MSIVGGATGGDLASMIGLLSDPKALKEKHAQLVEAQRQAQGVLDLVGPAQDVLALRDEAKAALDAAKEKLAAAKAKAEKIVSDAQGRADDALKLAQSNVEAANQGAADVRKSSDSIIKTAAAAADKVANDYKAVMAARTDLEEREAKLIADQQAIAEANQKLAARTAAVDKAYAAFKAAIG